MLKKRSVVGVAILEDERVLQWLMRSCGGCALHSGISEWCNRLDCHYPLDLRAQSCSPRQAIEHEQNAAISRTISLPPLALEAPSPSASADSSPKVLHPSCVVSSLGLKELQVVSNKIKVWKSRRSSEISNGTPIVEEPSSGSSCSSSFWSKLRSGSILSTACSAVS